MYYVAWVVHLKELFMKMKDIATYSPDLAYAIEKGHSHYSIEDDQAALFQLLVRSAKHSEESDHRQDVEIDNIKQRITDLENLIKKQFTK